METKEHTVRTCQPLIISLSDKCTVGEAWSLAFYQDLFASLDFCYLSIVGFFVVVVLDTCKLSLVLYLRLCQAPRWSINLFLLLKKKSK